jgi:hypothetical protein
MITILPCKIQDQACQTRCKSRRYRSPADRVSARSRIQVDVLAEHGEVVCVLPSLGVHAVVAGFQRAVAREDAEDVLSERGWEGNVADVAPVRCGCKYENLVLIRPSDGCSKLRVVSLEAGGDAYDVDMFCDRPLDCLLMSDGESSLAT